jgi:hypothetical protein
MSVEDVYLLILREPYQSAENPVPLDATIVHALTLLHRAVPQPDDGRMYRCLTEFPSRVPGCVVPLSTLTFELDGGSLWPQVVLAHERAHQRGHHHLLVALAGSLAAAFPRVRAFRQGHEQIARLVELLADDAAAAASPRLKVAVALLALAAPAPAAAAALGAGGSATVARVRRLIAAPAPLGRGRAVAGMLSVAALAVFPLVVLAGPAAAVSGRNYCPHTVTAAHAAPRPGHCSSC